MVGRPAASSPPTPARRAATAITEGTLRLYDVSGLLELKLPRGVRITASGHYGYP